MLKAEVINQAYAEIRISGLTSTEVPEEIELAIRELDQMMWQWQAMGRDVNYNFPQPTPDNALVESDPSDLFGAYPWAIQGVICALAKNLVTYFGKDVPLPLTRKAAFGLTVIKQQTVKLDPVQYPRRMPRGSGNTQWFSGATPRYYFPKYSGRQQPTYLAEEQISDLYFDFSRYLKEGVTLVSYTLSVEPQEGIEIQSDSQDENIVNYRVQATSWRDGVVYCNGTLSDGTTIPQVHRFEVVGGELVVNYA